MHEFRLTEEQARNRLTRMTAGEPALTTSDYDVLLEMARVAEPDLDVDGEPNPGWDLNAGAAEGWGWKASRLASQVDKGAEGANIASSQAFAHAERMREFYLSRSTAGTLSVSRFKRSDVIG